jgi:hypothetical protein
MSPAAAMTSTHRPAALGAQSRAGVCAVANGQAGRAA